MTDLSKPNGLLEDIGALIGFEATNRLVGIFGGGSLYIPSEASEGHPISRVVGLRRMELLCSEFGSEILSLPENEEFRRLRQLRRVATMLNAGHKVEAVADILALSARQVSRYRVQAEDLGLLPLIMTSKPGTTSRP